MILFEKLRVGLPLHDRDRLWDWMQKVERVLVDNFAVTPPLYKTEGRIGVNMADVIAQTVSGAASWKLAQITGVQRFTNSSQIPTGYPTQPPRGPSDGSGFSGGGANAIGGGDLGLAGQTQNVPTNAPPVYQYSWVPVTPSFNGLVVLTPGGSGSGQFLSLQGTTVMGSGVVTITGSIAGLSVGQSFLESAGNPAFPNGGQILSIDVQNNQITIAGEEATESGLFEFDFAADGPAYEANGYVVPVGQIVRLFPGYVDPVLGQTYLFDGADRPLAAKITSGSNPYAWTEQVAGAGGTWSAPGLNPNSGTTTFQPAYERNGNASVAAGTQVLLWRGNRSTQATGQEWVFEHQASGGGGGGGFLLGHVSTSCWYVGGLSPIATNGGGYTNYNPPAGRLYGMPFCSSRPGSLGTIAVQANNFPSTANIRLGVYAANNQAAGDLSPGALLADSGTIAVNAGQKLYKGTINLALTTNTIYWLSLLCDTSSAINVITLQSGSTWTPLGLLGDLNAGTPTINYGWFANGVTFGALPNPFPAATLLTLATDLPAILVNFSG